MGLFWYYLLRLLVQFVQAVLVPFDVTVLVLFVEAIFDAICWDCLVRVVGIILVAYDESEVEMNVAEIFGVDWLLWTDIMWLQATNNDLIRTLLFYLLLSSLILTHHQITVGCCCCRCIA